MLPKLYETENKVKRYVEKYFVAGWNWYAFEGQPQGSDFTYFGYVEGVENEWGYFLKSELDSVSAIRDYLYTMDDFIKDHPEEVSEYLETETGYDSGVV